MSSNIRNNQLNIKFTSKERKRFDNLFNSLQEQCNISPKRQSEIIIEGFFQYAENLLASYIPHTHTNSLSLTKQRKEAIYSIIELIKEKEYMYFNQTYSQLILENDCFSDLKTRTKSNYFQSLLQSEELYFIHIPYYFDTNSKSPLIIIHRKSPWYAQLKDLCFKIKNPILKVTVDNWSDAKLRDLLFEKLKRKANYKANLDRAERVMLNSFLYTIKQLNEKPMFDATDLVLREVIQLRSEHRFNEAKEVFNLEQKQKSLKKVSIDENLNFINSLEVVEK